MCSTSNTSKRGQIAEKPSNKTGKIFKGIAFNMLKHTYFMIRIYLERFIDFLFSLVWEGSKQAIPALDGRHSMLAESAVTLASRIRNKELKSEDLMKACIERIKIVNPILNAVTDERFDGALQDARAVDEMIQKGLPEEYFKEKPFLGVPFTAKESHGVAGMFYTLGLKSRKHIRAGEDAECVRLVRAAGAIPVAVTNVPEVNKWQETRNMVFGQTNNPHHSGRTTGGSSGGEAALAAALATPIALCSDIGGSTRMPAFFCGLYGLNPTAGYTSLKGSSLRTGLEPSIASIGFVSRHCGDLAPLTAVVAAEHASELGLHRTINPKDLKIYYTETAQDLRVSPVCQDLRDAMSRVLKQLTEDATSTDKAPKPYYHKGFDHMFALWKHAMTREAECFAKQLANNHGEVNGLVELPKKLLGLSPFTLGAILKVLDDQVLPAVDPTWADQLLSELSEDLTRVLGSDGVLVFPSAPAPAPYHYTMYLRPFNFAYWGIFNALKFPAVQVPLGLDKAGVPLGVQLVAAPRCEALCLALAARLGHCPLPCSLP